MLLMIHLKAGGIRQSAFQQQFLLLPVMSNNFQVIPVNTTELLSGGEVNIVHIQDLCLLPEALFLFKSRGSLSLN